MILRCKLSNSRVTDCKIPSCAISFLTLVSRVKSVNLFHECKRRWRRVGCSVCYACLHRSVLHSFDSHCNTFPTAQAKKKNLTDRAQVYDRPSRVPKLKFSSGAPQFPNIKFSSSTKQSQNFQGRQKTFRHRFRSSKRSDTVQPLASGSMNRRPGSAKWFSRRHRCKLLEGHMMISQISFLQVVYMLLANKEEDEACRFKLAWECMGNAYRRIINVLHARKWEDR